MDECIRPTSPLVLRLTKDQPVEIVRPGKAAEALKKNIDLGYVHLRFRLCGGIEIGVRLSKPGCRFDSSNFEDGTGTIHLEGPMILDFQKAKVIADIDLSTGEGTGRLVPVGDHEYENLRNSLV